MGSLASKIDHLVPIVSDEDQNTQNPNPPNLETIQNPETKTTQNPKDLAS
jgi:hypothetical protein